jgi:hypothetical protein
MRGLSITCYINQILGIQVDPFTALHRVLASSGQQHDWSGRRIHVESQMLGSVVVAEGTAYGCQGLDRQGYESGM